MSESETHKTVGVDGLVQFGQYLTTLDQESYRNYTFEMPGETGRCSPCSLDDVLRRFREFLDAKTDTFSVGVGYVDYHQRMIGHSKRTFTRQKK